jgi:hypothetical protein
MIGSSGPGPPVEIDSPVSSQKGWPSVQPVRVSWLVCWPRDASDKGFLHVSLWIYQHGATARSGNMQKARSWLGLARLVSARLVTLRQGAGGPATTATTLASIRSTAAGRGRAPIRLSTPIPLTLFDPEHVARQTFGAIRHCIGAPKSFVELRHECTLPCFLVIHFISVLSSYEIGLYKVISQSTTKLHVVTH